MRPMSHIWEKRERGLPSQSEANLTSRDIIQLDSDMILFLSFECERLKPGKCPATEYNQITPRVYAPEHRLCLEETPPNRLRKFNPELFLFRGDAGTEWSRD